MKVIIIVVAIVIATMMPVTLACAYGNGGGEEEMDNSFGMGTVGWSTGPLGLTLVGSPMWHGRPMTIDKGPDQREREMWEHEQELLDGFKSGKYTKENVKTTLEWAKKVGFHISDKAQKTLDALSPKDDFSIDKVRSVNGNLSPQNLVGNALMFTLIISSEDKISRPEEAFFLMMKIFTINVFSDDDD